MLIYFIRRDTNIGGNGIKVLIDCISNMKNLHLIDLNLRYYFYGFKFYSIFFKRENLLKSSDLANVFDNLFSNSN